MSVHFHQLFKHRLVSNVVGECKINLQLITANESISCSLQLLVGRLHPVLDTSKLKPNCFLEYDQWLHFCQSTMCTMDVVGLRDTKALDSKSGLRFKIFLYVFKWDHSLSPSLTMCFELPKHNKYVNHGGGNKYHSVIYVYDLRLCNYGQTIPSLCTQKCDLVGLRYISFNIFYVTV